MTSASSTPARLRAVAVVFLVMGVMAVVEIAVKLAGNTYYLTTGVLGIPICFGLLRHSPGWRTCAVVFVWWGLLFGPFVGLVALFGSEPCYFELVGIRIPTVPGWYVAASCLPFFVLNLWQLHVLLSPCVRRLFVRPRMVEAPVGEPVPDVE